MCGGSSSRWSARRPRKADGDRRRGFEELGTGSAHAVAGADGPRAELAAPVRACLAYARERRGMFELMFRHELLDGGGREVAPNGAPLREATLSLLRHVTSPSHSPSATRPRAAPNRSSRRCSTPTSAPPSRDRAGGPRRPAPGRRGGAMIVALDGTVLRWPGPNCGAPSGRARPGSKWTSTGYLVAEPACWSWPGGSAPGTHLRLLRLGLTGFGLGPALLLPSVRREAAGGRGVSCGPSPAAGPRPPPPPPHFSRQAVAISSRARV